MTRIVEVKLTIDIEGETETHTVEAKTEFVAPLILRVTHAALANRSHEITALTKAATVLVDALNAAVRHGPNPR